MQRLVAPSLIALACACALTNTHGSVIHGPVKNPANGNYYYLLSNNTWTASEAEAVGLGGHLATVNDAVENQWIFDTFGHFGGVERALWIGLSDAETEGTFKWASGEPVSFLNWDAVQPDNAGDEDYVHLFQAGGPFVPAKWNDLPNISSNGEIPGLFGVVEARVIKRWAARNNGANSGDDFSYAVAFDQAGNVITCGALDNGATDDDFVVTKKDKADGHVLWSYTKSGVGSSGNLAVGDRAKKAVVGADGTVYVAGEVTGAATGSVLSTFNDWYIVALNGDTGAVIWERALRGVNSSGDAVNSFDTVYDFALDHAGNLLVTGSLLGQAGGTAVVAKLDSNGNTLWRSPVQEKIGAGGSSNVAFRRLAVDSQNNVFVGGTAAFWGNGYELYLTKMDGTTGLRQWEAHAGLNTSSNGSGWGGIAVDANNDAFYSGLVFNGLGTTRADQCVIKVNGSTGAEVWRSLYDNSNANGYDTEGPIAIAPGGDVYVAGASQRVYDPGTGQGIRDIVTRRLDGATGAAEWTSRLEGSGDLWAWGLRTDVTGDAIVYGYGSLPGQGQDSRLIRYAKTDGALVWQTRYDNGNDEHVQTFDNLEIGPEGTIVIGARSYGSFGLDWATALFEQNVPPPPPDPIHLTDIVISSVDSNGESTGHTWDTKPGAFFNAWVSDITGNALNGPTDEESLIDVLLQGSTGLQLRAEPGSDTGFVRIELFFNGSASPGISVFGPTGAGAGQFTGDATHTIGTQTVTLRPGSLRWKADTGDLIGASAASPSGTPDYVGALALDLNGTPANLPPIAVTDVYHVPATGEATLNVLANDTDLDGDAFGLVQVNPPGAAQGTATVDGNQIRYTPGTAFTGSDEFFYTVQSGTMPGSIGRVIIRNAAPSAIADFASGSSATPVLIEVLNNDTDSDGDTLALIDVAEPGHGTAAIEGNHIVYTSESGFNGTDSFSYQVSDGHGGVVTGQIEVAIERGVERTVLFSRGAAVPGAGTTPGIPPESVFTSFGSPAINDAGEIAFVAGTRSPAGNLKGVYKKTIAGLQPQVLLGQPVPGVAGATFASFKDPLIAQDGSIVFGATIKGTTTPIASTEKSVACWSAGDATAPQLVVQAGRPLMIHNGATLKTISAMEIGNGGYVLVRGTLLQDGGSVTTANDSVEFSWKLPGIQRPVIREGQVVPSLGTVKSFKSLVGGATAPGAGRGWLQVRENGDVLATATATFTDGTVRLVEIDYTTGAFTTKVSTGINGVGKPLLPPGVFFKSLGLPSFSWGATNQGSFRGTLSNGTSALFDFDGTAGTPFFTVKQPAPGILGATINALKDPVLSIYGELHVWDASVKGDGVTSANDRVLYHSFVGQNPSVLAREGFQAVGCEPGAQWKTFNSIAAPSGNTGVLFTAALLSKIVLPDRTVLPGPGGVTSATDVGLWGVDVMGTQHLLLREGQMINGKPVKSFSVLKAVSGSPGTTRTFNNSGQVVALVTTTDGMTHIVQIDIPNTLPPL